MDKNYDFKQFDMAIEMLQQAKQDAIEYQRYQTYMEVLRQTPDKIIADELVNDLEKKFARTPRKAFTNDKLKLVRSMLLKMYL